MSYAITDIIKWAKISQPLAARDISICEAKGINHPTKNLPEILYEVRTTVEWKYSKVPSDSSLFLTGDYLYALCGKYINQAKKLAAIGGGISITPTSAGSAGVNTSLKGFRIEIPVGAGQQLVGGETSYVIGYSNIIENTVIVETPQSNLPQNATNQFSYKVNYTSNNVVINFFNDAGNGNVGVEAGMLLIITGLRVVYASTALVATPIPSAVTIDGTQIVSNSYDNTAFAGINLLIYHNGSRYLDLGIDYTVKTTGGFTLAGSYAGQAFTSADKFIVTPNGFS